MKVISIDCSTESENPKNVYGVLTKKGVFKDFVYYLIESESGCLLWRDSVMYTVIDQTAPTNWVRIQNKRNKTVYPVDCFNGDGAVTFYEFYGPALLVNPIENLIRISNADTLLSQKVMSLT